MHKKVKRRKRKRKLQKPLEMRHRMTVRVFQEIRLLITIFVLTLVILSSFSSLFYVVKKASGYGMMPTIRDKDILLIERNFDVKRFDLVLIDNGLEKEVRRIIGVPGENISYQADILSVNHQPLDEKFLIDKINDYQRKGMNFTQDFSLYEQQKMEMIPDKHYWVLGDNRPYTTDSREYGLIKEKQIVGKVILRIWPLDLVEKM